MEEKKPYTFLTSQVFSHYLVYPTSVVGKDLDLVPVFVGDPWEEDSKLKRQATLDGYRTVFVLTEDYDKIDHSKRYIFVEPLVAKNYNKEDWKEEWEKIWSKKDGCS